MTTAAAEERDVWVFVGDSITAFGWFAKFQATIENRFRDLDGNLTLPAWTTDGVEFDERFGAVPTFVNSGVSGDTVSIVEAAYATRIAKYGPTQLVILLGINDVIVGGPTPGATFTTKYQSLVDRTLADFPRCKITLCTLLVWGEKWPTGQNAADTTIEDYCTRIRNIATAGGHNLVDFRSTVYAIQEPALNPSNAASGVCYDSAAGLALHPTAATQDRMSTEMLYHFTLPENDTADGIFYASNVLDQFAENIELVTDASCGRFTRSHYRFVLDKEPDSSPDGLYFLDCESITPRARIWGTGDNFQSATITAHVSYARPGGNLNRGDRMGVMRNAADDMQRIADVCENPANYNPRESGIRTIHYDGSRRIAALPRSEIWESRFLVQWDTRLSTDVTIDSTLDPPGYPLLWHDSANMDGTFNASLTDGAGVATRINMGSLGSGASQSQGTSASRPLYRAVAHSGRINNQPAIEGNGSRWLAASVPFTSRAQPYMVATVFRMISITGTYYLYTGYTEGQQCEMVLGPAGAGVISMNNGVGGFVSTGQSVSANQWVMSIAVHNGASSYHRLNGTQSSSFNTNAVAFTGVTSLASLTGLFGAPAQEAVRLCWTGALVTDLPAVADVEAYLVKRFGSFPQT